MAYATYTTEALVCGSKDSYTSDRSFLLFTEEAGMLWATARSVREERSKQRNALQDFSFIRVSLVKGKTGWRIGSVEALGNPFLEARSRSERAFVKNVVTLLRRYIHGEQSIPQVFSDTRYVLTELELAEDADRSYTLFTLRMLYALGYISKVSLPEGMLDSSQLSVALDQFNESDLPKLEKLIAQAHELSHL